MTGNRIARSGFGPARWLVRRLLTAEDAVRLLDALEEELVEHQNRERGPLRARFWYWRQALWSAWILRRQRHEHGVSRRLTVTGGLADVLREARLVVRSFSRTPGFAGATVAMLAVGLGAATTLFSVVDQVVLRPLPYRDSDRIIRASTRSDDGDIEDFSFRVVEYRELVRRPGLFDAVGGEFPTSLPVNLPGQPPFQVQGRMITPDLFDVFGVRPTIGRMFRAGEIAGGDVLVAVVTHRFWTQRLGGVPEALGRPVDLGGRPYSVVGVLPAGYHHVSGADVDVFVPYTIGTKGWIGRWLDLYARLPAASTLAAAEDEITAVMAGIGQTDPRSKGWRATVSTLHDAVIGNARRTAWATFAASALLLAIAIANVAILMLARGAIRMRELALRMALGASRARLVRLALTESAIVAAGGGALGALGAWFGVRALVVVAPSTFPRIADLSLDPIAVLFCAGIAGVAAALCALLPALRLTRLPAVAPGHARTTTPGARFGGLLSGLVITEVALAALLVVAAALLARTFLALNEQEYGFRRGAALTFRVSPPPSRWPGRDGTLTFYRELRDRLRALPGVTAVGAGSNLPLGGQGAVTSVTSDPRIASGQREGITALQRWAGVGYFEALGTPLLEGRPFEERDGPATPRVAVVSASLARVLFPGESAVGRRVAFGGEPGDADWMTVVGVVADMRFTRADRPDDPQIYQVHAQSAVREMALFVRTATDTAAIVAAAEAAIADVDPRVPAYDVAPLESVVSRAIAATRFTTWLFGAFSLSALALAVAGIYSVVAFAIGCRQRELGVRLALGARPRDIARLVVGQMMRIVFAGIFLGLAGATAAGRVLEGLLYGVAAIDAGSYLGTALVLGLVALAACYVPIRRSVLPDPLHVLRPE